MSGFATLSKTRLNKPDFESAYENFASYEQMLPGNPNTVFFKGFCLEGMQRKEQSANEYYRYLQAVNEGDYAQHAYQRLVEWGYIKP
jgi:hypothetical protein